jgi:hypothetical protein
LVPILFRRGLHSSVMGKGRGPPKIRANVQEPPIRVEPMTAVRVALSPAFRNKHSYAVFSAYEESQGTHR